MNQASPMVARYRLGLRDELRTAVPANEVARGVKAPELVEEKPELDKLEDLRARIESEGPAPVSDKLAEIVAAQIAPRIDAPPANIGESE